ncbi:MAG: serine/threonine protein kinase [Rhizobiales bacterium]|nr:serine/threonine protein kinase [Hyphomicrobiales bacterium]
MAFEFREEIGADGKNSQTFLAYDHQLDANIVIKKIAKADIEDRETYFEESRRLYASAHPNVVQLHYACEDDDHIFVAMPFYRKGSLKHLINERYLTVREIVAYGCQIASGLHNIHSKGLIHFDVKADNVLLSDRNEALISDFGLAMAQNTAGKALPYGVYVPITPPESLSEFEFDRTYDIYQFGIALYVMCNGPKCLSDQVSSFEIDHDLGANAFYTALTDGKFPDRKAFLPHIPSKLRRIIVRCLNIDPGKRYLSALDVANDLAQVDGLLDWHFEVLPTGRRWTRAVNGTIIVLDVEQGGSSVMTKSVNGSKAKRQTNGCKVNLTDAGISKLLGAS